MKIWAKEQRDTGAERSVKGCRVGDKRPGEIKIKTQRDGSTCCQTCTHSTTRTGFHINSSHSCRVSTQQTAWGKHKFSQNDGGRERQRPRRGTVGSYYKGGDYLGGCGGGQLLHCRGSESDDGVS